MRLRLIADAVLFWPKEGEPWPNLQDFSVQFMPSSPSGRWYFCGTRGSGSDTAGYEVTEQSWPLLEDTPEDLALHLSSSDDESDAGSFVGDPYEGSRGSPLFRKIPNTVVLNSVPVGIHESCCANAYSTGSLSLCANSLQHILTLLLRR